MLTRTREVFYRHPATSQLFFSPRHWCLTLFITLTQVLAVNRGFAQVIYQPYSYQFYQKLNNVVYSRNTLLHSSVKPFLINDSSVLRKTYDSLMSANRDTSEKRWFYRKIYQQHLIEVKHADYTFSADFLPDLQVGRELAEPKSVWLNTRGYQFSGTIGKRFFFYTSGYENQGGFANYETAYIRTIGMIPGEAYNRSIYGLHTDWSYVTTMIGYQLKNWLTIEMGEDKTFIGDGYRSVLLSDYAAPYPLLRVNLDITKNVRYMAMWAYLEDRTAPQFASFFNNRRKWGVFHYIDWNINKRASLGFFNALIAEEATDQGKYHGFDINYINPAFFLSSLSPPGTLADHVLFGFNAKYKLLNKTVLYGQFLNDEAPINSVAQSLFSWQAGVKGSDLLGLDRLNYLFEFNTASPYTYSAPQPIMSYAQLNEPLADPLGSNFKEWLGILNYSVGRFDLQGQLNFARYGLNTTVNYGKDITQPSNVNTPANQSGTGQGLSTLLKYAEGTVGYIFNPRYNLRLEAGAIIRQETNSLTNTKTFLLTLGLRSTFRDLYHDF